MQRNNARAGGDHSLIDELHAARWIHAPCGGHHRGRGQVREGARARAQSTGPKCSAAPECMGMGKVDYFAHVHTLYAQVFVLGRSLSAMPLHSICFCALHICT